jgi:hypothetical protein
MKSTFIHCAEAFDARPGPDERDEVIKAMDERMGRRQKDGTPEKAPKRVKWR